MKSGTYVAEISPDMTVSIPKELIQRIDMKPGDRVEVLIKKIRPGKKIVRTTEESMLDILKIGKDEA